MRSLGSYMMLTITIVTLFIGTGSVTERLQRNWHTSLILLILYFILHLPIRKVASLATDDFKDKTPISLSYATRVTFAIISSLLLLTGIAELIWNIIPFHTPLYGVAILCFPGGLGLWYLALYDPTKKKINWDMVKKQ